jgi:cation:H+ antiporter
VLLGIGLTLFASSYLFIMLRRGHLRPWHLTLNGLCYLAFFLTLTW